MHTINFPGSNEFEYLFTQIWVSISHTEIPNTFDSISVKFSGLKENINHIPFDIKYNQTNNEYTISIDKANLKKEIISLNEVRLSSICKTNRKRTRLNEITFQYENSLKFEYKNNLTSDKCISNALNIAYIFSFITNEKHKIKSIILYSKKEAFRVFVDLPFNFKEIHKTKITYVTKDLFQSLDNELQYYLKSLINYDEKLHGYLKEYRRYYSHYFPPSEKPIYQKDNIFNISNFVLQLHKFFIMYKIGIPSSEIVSLLKIIH